MSWFTRISTNLQEVRVLYCDKSNSSIGARNFIKNNYSVIKRLNPSIPFIVRQNENIDPWLVARYDFGAERRIPISNFTEKQVIDELKKMVDIGEVTFKADLYAFQESFKDDTDVVDYDRDDPDMHHL